MWLIRLAHALILAAINEHAENVKFTEQHTNRRS